MKTFNNSRSRLLRGFTLAESVIALGILVVLITGFLAVFGPAASTIKKTLSTDEASRLQATLIFELTHLREGQEETRYQDDPFRKAFEWISQSHDNNNAILIYKYRAIPGQKRPDGTLQPAPRELGLSGIDFVITPMVRRISDNLLQEDLDSIDGRVFFVKLNQLIFDGGGMRVSNGTGTIVDPHKPGEDFARRPESFPEAVLAFEAEYYNLPTTSFQYLSNAFDPDDFTKPIFTRKLAVRR